MCFRSPCSMCCPAEGGQALCTTLVLKSARITHVFVRSFLNLPKKTCSIYITHRIIGVIKKCPSPRQKKMTIYDIMIPSQMFYINLHFGRGFYHRIKWPGIEIILQPPVMVLWAAIIQLWGGCRCFFYTGDMEVCWKVKSVARQLTLVSDWS